MHTKRIISLVAIGSAALSLGGAARSATRDECRTDRAERQRASSRTSRERRAHRLPRGAQRRVASGGRATDPRTRSPHLPLREVRCRHRDHCCARRWARRSACQMHNALAAPMWVYGLGEQRGFADSVQLAPGETREIRFRATHAGTLVLRRAHVRRSGGRTNQRRLAAQRRDRDRPAGRDAERSHFRDLELVTRSTPRR